MGETYSNRKQKKLKVFLFYLDRHLKPIKVCKNFKEKVLNTLWHDKKKRCFDSANAPLWYDEKIKPQLELQVQITLAQGQI